MLFEKGGHFTEKTTLLATRTPNGFNLTLVSNPQLIEIKMWLHEGFSLIVFACYSDQPWKKWLQIFQSSSLVNCGIFFSSVMWSWPTTNAVTSRWFINALKCQNDNPTVWVKEFSLRYLGIFFLTLFSRIIWSWFKMLVYLSDSYESMNFFNENWCLYLH